jgi:hypothetical protein
MDHMGHEAAQNHHSSLLVLVRTLGMEFFSSFSLDHQADLHHPLP